MEAIDTLIQDRHLEMIKAAIPYLDNSRQRNMAMLVKFMELQRTMSLFQNSGNDLQMCHAFRGVFQRFRHSLGRGGISRITGGKLHQQLKFIGGNIFLKLRVV